MNIQLKSHRLEVVEQEDDSGEIVQTIHGAATVFGALEISARAARFIGEGGDARRWEKRYRAAQGDRPRALRSRPGALRDGQNRPRSVRG